MLLQKKRQPSILERINEVTIKLEWLANEIEKERMRRYGGTQ